MRVRYVWAFKCWVVVFQDAPHIVRTPHVIYRHLRGAGWMRMQVGEGKGWQPCL